MPNGYTSDIYNGKDVTLKEFALKCARNFGALIHMRDESLDAPIRLKNLEDSYHKKRIEQLESELENLKSNPKSIEDLEKEYELEILKIKAEDEKRNKEIIDLKSRYESLLKQVEAWIPPTNEHINLKNFMIRQLTESIEFDCIEYSQLKYFPSKEDWIKEKLSNSRLYKDLEYHKTEFEKYKSHTIKSNEWIIQLEESLNNK